MEYPSPEQIQLIVMAALSVPSGDNCQPWTFEYLPPNLYIRHDNNRARHLLNPRNFSSAISLGCVFEAIAIAASQFGFKTHRQVTGENEDLAARIDFEFDENLTSDPLVLSISHRTTDRRLYAGGTPEDPVMKDLSSLQGKFGTIRLHVSNQYTEAFWDHLSLSDYLFFNSYGLLQDILKWVRFSTTEAEVTRDGLHYKNLGASLPESLVLRAMKGRPTVHAMMKNLGISKQAAAMTRKQVKSSAALILFTADNFDLASIVDTGRMMYRTWLMLNQAGYGVQPLSLPSLGLFYSLYYELNIGMNSEEKLRFQSGLSSLKNVFQFENKASPIWMFRTGISTPLPKELRTLRRPLEDVFIQKIKI